MAELKPCPFCGYVYPDKIEGNTLDGKITYSVRCGRCGIGIFRAKMAGSEKWDCFKSINEAVDAWNRRADDGA